MEILKKYPCPFTTLDVDRIVIEAKALIDEMFTVDNLKTAFSLIDLTSLNADDTCDKIIKMTQKVDNFNNEFPDIPNVAAICVYPPFVKTVATYQKNKTIALASVGAGFPSSQTYIEVKTLECEKAGFDGATDIDIVISLGKWKSGEYQTVYDEIKAVKKAVGNRHLKVILETGILSTCEEIWKASLVAMEAGADFIKTSTGKTEPAATPDAAVVMCEAIKEYHKHTGRKVGFKPAGGISTSKDAIYYMAIVKSILGNEWLNNKLMRIGASRLANNLLTDINKQETGENSEIKYF